MPNVRATVEMVNVWLKDQEIELNGNCHLLLTAGGLGVPPTDFVNRLWKVGCL